MKLAVIVILGLAAAATAKPIIAGGGGFGGNISGGVGMQGLGSGGLGLSTSVFQQGAEYANAAFSKGNRAFGSQGFQTGGLATSYDRGQQESSFSSITQGHQSSSHDRGTAQVFGTAANSMGGFENFENGMQGMGANFSNGQQSTFVGA